MLDTLRSKIGNKVFAVPVIFGLLIALIFGIALYPMLSATPHNIRFAIVSLDEGATTFAGSTNVGDTMVDKITSGETSFLSGSNTDTSTDSSATSTIGTDAIKWEVMNSEQEVRDAINAGENLYGAIIIPKTFTADQMSSVVGISNAAELKVLLNYGYNPIMATNLQATLQNMMLKNGIATDVEMVNKTDLGGGTMASTMGIQMMVMPLLVMSIIPTLLFFLIKWPGRSSGRKERAKGAGLQLLYTLAASLIVACCAVCIDIFAGGMNLPVGNCILLLWLGSFAMMLFLQGLNDIALPLGVLGGLCLFCLGLGCVMFGQEMMPEFWANFVYPFAPQAALGEGLRHICYMGWSVGQCDLGRLFGTIGVGLCAMVISVCLPQKKAPVV